MTSAKVSFRSALRIGLRRRGLWRPAIQGKLLDTAASLHYILDHPMAQGQRCAVLMRWIRWQLGGRLVPGPVAVPFVNETRLLVAPGMTGVTGNVYVGLHEFESMAFVLHLLREGDRFVDVGANAGSYTVLASGAVGAPSIAFEPVPSTFKALEDNIALNRLEVRTCAINAGVSREEGSLRFSMNSGPMNHVVESGGASCPVTTLDRSVPLDERNLVLKIDTEGFESEVMAGAQELVSSGKVLGLLIELAGAGSRYGGDEASLFTRLTGQGFIAVRYEPWSRSLARAHAPNPDGNTLLIRDWDEAVQRLTSSPRFRVGGRSL